MQKLPSQKVPMGAQDKRTLHLPCLLSHICIDTDGSYFVSIILIYIQNENVQTIRGCNKPYNFHFSKEYIIIATK